MSAVADPRHPDRRFPTAAGIFFGLGLGGFFDGILLHQVLQWHHMLSSWYPVNTIENLDLNTRWDGIFHSATYLFVLIGLFLLWRAAHRAHLFWSTKLLVETMLLGLGIFNTVEGIVDHHWLGIHHVNETVSREQMADLRPGLYDLGHRYDRGRLADHEGRPPGAAAMSRAVPPVAMYVLFAVGAAAATLPLWRLFVFGFNPTLDELLRLGCLQP